MDMHWEQQPDCQLEQTEGLSSPVGVSAASLQLRNASVSSCSHLSRSSNNGVDLADACPPFQPCGQPDWLAESNGVEHTEVSSQLSRMHNEAHLRIVGAR